jgi:hypothetical protein
VVLVVWVAVGSQRGAGGRVAVGNQRRVTGRVAVGVFVMSGAVWQPISAQTKRAKKLNNVIRFSVLGVFKISLFWKESGSLYGTDAELHARIVIETGASCQPTTARRFLTVQNHLFSVQL